MHNILWLIFSLLYPMNETQAWSVRIVTRKARWWEFASHVEEAFLIQRFNDRLVMVGMCNKGFGYMIDNRQYSGEATLNGLTQTTFRIDGKGDMDRLFYCIGRKEINGIPLTGAKAIAYIFGLNWKNAIPETLRGHAVCGGLRF